MVFKEDKVPKDFKVNKDQELETKVFKVTLVPKAPEVSKAIKVLMELLETKVIKGILEKLVFKVLQVTKEP